MAACDIQDCDGDHLLSYTCNECENTYCTEHRLPESHDCTALRRSNSSNGEDEKRFATGLQEKPGKRGITSRDDKTGASASSSNSESTTSTSPTEADSESAESNSNTTEGNDEINLSRHGPGTPSSMDLNESQTVGTAKEPTESPSPDVETDGSISRPHTTTEATETERTKTATRFRLWATGVLTTASSALSDRFRRVLSWLWWLFTGVARLSGAAATLVGLGWITVNVIQIPETGPVQLLWPSIQPVAVTVVGLFLVVWTARVGPD